MYSYADRLRVVELHIKLGKRVKATVRQLGYPTKPAAAMAQPSSLDHILI